MLRLTMRLAMLGAGLLLLTLPSTGRAANAVGIQSWDGGGATASVDAPGDTASASNVAGLAASMAGNPGLNGSAWAHTGDWWNVHLGALSEVTIRVDAANPDEFAPGFSVWAIGSSPFDGGTTGTGGEISTAGFGTPHSFNATGTLGDAGTLWMQNGQGGNAQELIGYAISGPSFLGTTGWGETIANGAHDQRVGDDFVASVAGNVGDGFAELVLGDVAEGWYLIYVGGTDPSLAGGLYNLGVRAIPEPSTALLVALGLGVISRRRKAATR